MKATAAGAVLWTILAMTLNGCGAWENATVTISYGADAASDGWRLDTPSRKRIEEVFRSFSVRAAYKCTPHIKRTEELSCHGPKDLRLTFQPSLNKPEYVAHFTWVSSSERTRDEFLRHVAEFKTALSAVGDVDVRIESST